MRIVIIDDDTFVTTSLSTILSVEEDIEVVGVGSDGTKALELYKQHQPDILLMDIQMKEMSGLDAAVQVLDDYSDARIVFLTTFADDEYIVSALRLGAKGYLIKQEVAVIAPALRSVMVGQSVLGSEILGRMDSLVDGAAKQKHSEQEPHVVVHSGKLAGLSERENEIVALIANGLDNKEIANTLYISEGTVRNHISAILAKLCLKNRTQLAILYYRS